jgi:DNA primase
MPDTAAEVKARSDLVEVVAGYVQLQKAGQRYKGLCPFHPEKTPSFTVSPDRQAWYCFGCQDGGDVYDFVEKIEHVDFRQALELLAERVGVEIERGSAAAGRASARRRRRTLELNARAQSFFQHVLWSMQAGRPGRELLAERRVGDEVARAYGLGFAPAGGPAGDALVRYLRTKAGATPEEIVEAGLAYPAGAGPGRDRFRHRLTFPIRDDRGATIAFGARALGEAMPKYLNSPETAAYRKSTALFGIDLARQAIAESTTAVVVEGYFDVIAAHTAGVRNVVASSGTALTREQVRYLGRHARTLVLCFDFDDAGRAAASRAVDVVAAEGLQARICTSPSGEKDPDEVVRRDPAAFAALVRDAEPEWKVLLDGAIAGAEGGRLDARRAAAERAVALLVRIPEATTRELYAQETARRLDIGTASLMADLNRARHDRRGERQRLVMQSPSVRPGAAPASGHDTPDAALDAVPPAWELHLGALVVHRPALAGLLLESMGLDLAELSAPSIRRLVEVARGVDSGGFPMHLLAPADHRLAASLLVRDLPELAEGEDGAALQRALEDCVRYVHEESLRRSLAAVQHQLDQAKEAGRDDDVELLATRLLELAAETPHLRRTLAGR